jgi:hypothetical protein
VAVPQRSSPIDHLLCRIQLRSFPHVTQELWRTAPETVSLPTSGDSPGFSNWFLRGRDSI